MPFVSHLGPYPPFIVSSNSSTEKGKDEDAQHCLSLLLQLQEKQRLLLLTRLYVLAFSAACLRMDQ